MKEVRKILVGLDLGPNGKDLTSGSRRAVDSALWLAKATGARVLLLHSSSRDETYDEVQGSFVIVHDGLSPEGEAALTAVVDQFRQDGVRTELAVVEERPGDAIAQRTEQETTDVVVLGKRSAADSDNRRLGSLSRRLLTECAPAVWAVKAEVAARPERVLAVCELDAVGRKVLLAAALFARLSGAELHVLHALQVTLATQMDRDRAEIEKEMRQKATLELHERLAECDPEAEAHAKFHVGFDSPSHAILTAEKKLAPDLVVLGTSSRRGVAGWLLGSTAARMLDRLDCSLLAIKPEAAKPAKPA